jgi:hypothetical protein
VEILSLFWKIKDSRLRCDYLAPAILLLQYYTQYVFLALGMTYFKEYLSSKKSKL